MNYHKATDREESDFTILSSNMSYIVLNMLDREESDFTILSSYPSTLPSL